MKTCLKCKAEFKTTIVVDGKTRNLGSRSFCLTCSPFGLHNTLDLKIRTRNIIDSEPSIQTRTCSICQENLPLELFKVYKRGQLRRIYPYCAKCDSNRVKQNKKNLKKILVEYKGGKCQMCGYNKALTSLHFHHVEPQKKEFSISQYKKQNIENLKKEVDKCILVCANCHGELHEIV